MIVALEGIDACGKGTQSQLLISKLSDRGVPAELFKFPSYEHGIGGVIGDLLKEKWGVHSVDSDLTEDQLRSLVLQALMTLNRLEYFEYLQEWKSRSGVLVLDRYYASGIAYGTADGLDMKWLKRVHVSLPPPDLWIFLDIDPKLSVTRRPDRDDEYETRDGFLHTVRANYVTLAGEPTWKVIDGSLSPDQVADEIWKAVNSKLTLQGSQRKRST